MKKKKAVKMAKKLKKYCHRTRCSVCPFYKNRCALSGKPVPAYWEAGKEEKPGLYEMAADMMQNDVRIEYIAAALDIPIREADRITADIRKADAAAGIREGDRRWNTCR